VQGCKDRAASTVQQPAVHFLFHFCRASCSRPKTLIAPGQGKPDDTEKSVLCSSTISTETRSNCTAAVCVCHVSPMKRNRRRRPLTKPRPLLVSSQPRPRPPAITWPSLSRTASISSSEHNRVVPSRVEGAGDGWYSILLFPSSSCLCSLL